MPSSSRAKIAHWRRQIGVRPVQVWSINNTGPTGIELIVLA